MDEEGSDVATKAFNPDFKAIPTEAMTPAYLAGLTRNITTLHRQTEPHRVAQGRLWYPVAHDIASEVGGGDTSRGAGMIATLSSGQDWDLNLLQADQMSRMGGRDFDKLARAQRRISDAKGVSAEAHEAAKLQHKALRGELFRGTPLNNQSTANIVKAHRVQRGESPADVLPMSVKTGNFYRNIYDPSDPEPVTIDTHAHDIAYGEKLPYADTPRNLDNPNRYNNVALSYRNATRRLNAESGVVQTPGATQAVTWGAWRRRHGRPSSWDASDRFPALRQLR